MRGVLAAVLLALGGCSAADAEVDAGQQPDGGSVPPEIGSHQWVRFDIANDGGQARVDGGQLIYVVDSSNSLCDAVPIERRSAGAWEMLPLRIGNASTCGNASANTRRE